MHVTDITKKTSLFGCQNAASDVVQLVLPNEWQRIYFLDKFIFETKPNANIVHFTN